MAGSPDTSPNTDIVWPPPPDSTTDWASVFTIDDYWIPPSVENNVSSPLREPILGSLGLDELWPELFSEGQQHLTAAATMPPSSSGNTVEENDGKGKAHVPDHQMVEPSTSDVLAMPSGENLGMRLRPEEISTSSTFLLGEKDTSDGATTMMGAREAEDAVCNKTTVSGEMQSLLKIAEKEEEAIPPEQDPKSKKLETHVACSSMKQNGRETVKKKKEQKKKSLGVSENQTKRTKVKNDPWMPAGWWKEVKPRSSTGKRPGYPDQFFHAPGVKQPFRSKRSSLEYIGKLKNAATAGENHNDT